MLTIAAIGLTICITVPATSVIVLHLVFKDDLRAEKKLRYKNIKHYQNQAEYYASEAKIYHEIGRDRDAGTYRQLSEYYIQKAHELTL